MSTDPDRRATELIASWYARIDAGETPDLSEHCAAAPELKPQIAEILARDDEVADAMAALADGAGTGLLAERLGGYRIVSRLGAGGMGQVFLARQEALGRDVALKVLHGHLSWDRAAKLRFRREAEITAELDHPNIVPVYGTGEHDGHLWLAMKLLTGPSLDAAPTPLTPKEVARRGARLARALHAAHLVGVVHRDVKPANVMMDGDEPVILDFGLARSQEGPALTQTGAAPGTLGYMAPERLRGRADLDPRLDVYGLGATLYETLAGKPPFTGDNAGAVIHRVLDDEPPPLEVPRHVRDLEIIVRRALEKDPARRFATALEMAEDLERFLEDRPITSRSVGTPERITRWAKRNRLSAALSAVLLLGLATLGAAYVADRLASARDASTQRQRIDELIDAGATRAARAALRDERTRRGEGPALDALAKKLQQRAALESVLDHLQSELESQDSKLLSREVTALERTDEESPWRDLRSAALALVALRDRRNGDALALIRRTTRTPRTRAALEAVAQEDDSNAALAEASSPSSSDDHLLAALVLRHADRGRAAIERELETALRIDPHHYRARYAMAILEYEHGNLRAARQALLALRDHPRLRPVARLGLARLHAVFGDAALARTQIARAERALSDPALAATWTPLASVDVFARFRSGAVTEARAALQSALALRPDHPWLNLLAAWDAGRRGDPQAAHRHARIVLEGSSPGRMGRQAQALLLTIDLRRLRCGASLQPVSGLTASERSTLEELTARTDRLLAGARAANDQRQMSTCWLMHARVQRILGYRERAWYALRTALAVDGDSPAANLRFALEVRRRLSVGDDDPDAFQGPVGALLIEALHRAQRVTEPGDHPVPPSAEELMRAWHCVAEIALRLRRGKTCVRAAETWLELHARYGDAASARAERRIRRMLARARHL